MKTFLLALALALTFAGARAQPFNPRLARALQDTLNKYVAALSNIKGASVSVYLPGREVWTGTAGVSHAGVPIAPNMLFGIASNTKLFVATVMLKLAENGALDLDAPISAWIAPYPNIDGSATVRQLLQHTSGISDPLFVAPWVDTIRNNSTRVFTPDEVMQWVGKPLFAPGKGWGYSNMNYVIAGLIAERASGKHIATLIRELILSPLGLNDVFFDVKENSPGPVAHRWFNGADVHDSSRVGLNTAGASAGALFSTSADMVRWYAAVLDGDLLDSTSFNELTSFVATPGPYTYGLGIERQTFFGHDVWGHGGSTWGYRSRMVYDPCLGAAVCGISNSWPSGIEGVALLLYNVIIERLPACAASITGPSSLCQGQRSATFTTPIIQGADSYEWSLPDGVKGASTTNTITVEIADTATSDIIIIRGVNTYGEGGRAHMFISITPKPPTPTITYDRTRLRSDAATGNQWHNTKGKIDGAVGQFYAPLAEDTYHVVVTKDGCISGGSNPISVSVTGVDVDDDDQHILVLYPNPVRTVLMFSTPLTNISIVNTIGQTVLHVEGSVSSIPTSELSPGIYQLRSGNVVRTVVVGE
ncbi:MAG: serine hydrolase [Ignavibacteria bacterium]|nr:serine hydrolase [Ignavibacteria bacterium]